MLSGPEFPELQFQHFLFDLNKFDPHNRSCATFAEYMLSLTPGSQLIERDYNAHTDLDEVAENLIVNTESIGGGLLYDPRIARSADLVALYMDFNIILPAEQKVHIFRGKYPKHFMIPDKTDDTGMIFQRPAIDQEKQRVYGPKAVERFFEGYPKEVEKWIGAYPQNIQYRIEYRVKK